jgi:cellulose synthase/poly-beta-1,6-N-acetylglucosamine synthase-like glycosyltransferase
VSTSAARGERPAVSVVVPFAGDRTGAERLARALSPLRTFAADEVVVADNSPAGVAMQALDGVAETVRADEEASSYHARNRGAERARGEWLLFVDADCVPDPDLLDAYFADPVPARCGALAGEIAADGREDGFLARYSRSRNLVSQRDGLHSQGGITAATGNLMIRRLAFDAVGGFAEGIRSGGDVDICLRLHEAGWSLLHRPSARVVHPYRRSVRDLLAANARYGAGARWLDERHGGISAGWPLIPGIAGSIRDAVARTREGQHEEAAFRLLDAANLTAHHLGYRSDNRSHPLRS